MPPDVCGGGQHESVPPLSVAATRATHNIARPDPTGDLQSIVSVKTLVPGQLLCTIGQTGEILQLSRPTIYRMIANGDLVRVRCGRAARITYASIADWVARQAEPIAQKPDVA